MTPVALPAQAADPLADLHGYHLPAPVSWWPPAPGWWLLALLCLVALGALIHWLATRYRRTAATRAARAELTQLVARHAQDGDGPAFARDLSRLLRRFALVRFPRRQVAGLTGTAWLEFLDAHGGDGRFGDGPGRLLVEAPYRASTQRSAAESAALVESWILHNRERGA